MDVKIGQVNRIEFEVENYGMKQLMELQLSMFHHHHLVNIIVN